MSRQTITAKPGSMSKGNDTGEKKSLKKKIVLSLHSIIDFIIVTVLVFLLIFVTWAKWDSDQLYTAADPIQYLQYKPSPPYMLSFEELQKINPDVIGWLTVYGTKIDYPLVQSKKSNDEYLDKNPIGEHEASGSIFMDMRCDPNFADFNTIIYGHHMEKNKMFGGIDEFANEDYFNEHEYGNIVFNAQNHGIHIIAICRVDAYDNKLYDTGITSEEKKFQYIDHIYDTAVFIRGVDVKTQKRLPSTERKQPITPSDKLVILSTCSEEFTNGRLVLVCKMLDHSVENPFPDETTNRNTSGIDTDGIIYRIGKLSLQQWAIILIALIILILILYILETLRYRKKLGETAYDQDNK